MLSKLILAVAIGLSPLPAAAMEVMEYLDAPGAPMPNRLYLKIIGEFSSGDAADLRDQISQFDHIPLREIAVYLDSTEGSVDEALKIAEVLRARPEIVRTHVGEQDATGDCASACVLVFASGDFRYLSENGRIGLPDASEGTVQSVDEVAASEVAALLSEQRISQDVLPRLLSEAPKDTQWASPDLLEDWGLVTGDVAEQSSEYVEIDGTTWLRLHQRSIYGDNEIKLRCDDRGIIVGTASIDQPQGVTAGEFYAVIDGASMSPASSKVVTEDGRRSEVSFEMLPYQARLMRSAGSIGARVMDVSQIGFWGFEYELDNDALRALITGCHDRP